MDGGAKERAGSAISKFGGLGRTSRRVAFVLGNGNYGAQYGDLDNPVRDAEAVAAKLNELGFDVQIETDLTEAQTGQAFDLFLKRIKRNRKQDTALIYYAGHGFQEDGENFILTTPDETGEIGAFPVFFMIEALKRSSDRRILFFDACRDGFETEAVALSIAKTRSVSGRKPQISAGFSDARANFGEEYALCFSAPPGKKAFDAVPGGSELSPYAKALVDNIGSVDLPFSNVITRVNVDMSEMTEGRQQSWLVTSLKEPYYFNASSLLVLIGNLIAFGAFLYALALAVTAQWAIGYAQALGVTRAWHVPGMVVALLAFSGGALLFGIMRAYNRARGARLDQGNIHDDASAQPLHGAIGGLLGGILASPLIAFPYWRAWRGPRDHCNSLPWYDAVSIDACMFLPQLLVEIALAGVFIAGVLGYFTVIYFNKAAGGLNWLERWLSKPWRPIAGAGLGGLITGVLVGAPVTVFFGAQDRPFLEPSFIWVIAPVSAAIISFSILNYSLETYHRSRFYRSLVSAGLGTVLMSLILGAVVGLLYLLGFIQAMLNWAEQGFHFTGRPLRERVFFLAVAGLPYGAVFGFFLGLLIGMTRSINDNWDDLADWLRSLRDMPSAPWNAKKSD